MKAERYLAKDIENITMNEVKKCLREYYAYSNTEPVDDYFDVESDENLRQHMFEAVVALLTHYNIGIKHTTTDEEIENMDTVFLYKELHKINVLSNPAYKFHNTIATNISFARMYVTKYRDDLVTDEKRKNTTYNHEDENNGTNDLKNEALCNDDIIRRIQGRATAMGIQVYRQDLDKLTNGELQEELVKVIQKEKIQRPVVKKGRAYKELNEKEKQTQNLFGVYTTKFDPNSNENEKQKKTTNLPPPKEKDVNQTSASAVKTTRVEIFIQPKLAFQGKTPNATKIIKEYLFQMRRADAMFKIHPVDKNNESQNDILDSEEDLPNNQMEMNAWVQNIKIKGNRLFFDMRVSTIDFEGMKAHLFAWSKGKGHYTTFSRDKKISELFPAGWLHGISARHYNRDHIYEYIIAHKPNLKGFITVYAKTVFYYRKDNSKVKTYAIAIDGSWEKQQEILEFLYEHEWEGRYKKVTYVPYKTNQYFTKEDQVRMTVSQNEYDHSIAKYVIKVKYARNKYETCDGETTFQEWLHKITIGGQKMITGVEVAPNDIVRVIFKKEHRDEVVEVLRNIYTHVLENFGEEISQKLLDFDQCAYESAKHAKELEYGRKLREKHLSNPQTDEHPTQFRDQARLVFGSYAQVTGSNDTHNIIPPSQTEKQGILQQQIDNLTKSQKELETKMTAAVNEKLTNTFSQTSTITDENDFQSQLNNLHENQKKLELRYGNEAYNENNNSQSELESKISELSKAQQKLEQKVTTTLAKEVKSVVEAELKPLKETLEKEQKIKNENFEGKINAITELMEEQNEAYDKRFQKIQGSMESSITTTLSNALDAYFKKKTPSGTEESSRGGGQ